MVREHLVEKGNEHQKRAGHGIIRKYHFSINYAIIIIVGSDEMLNLRWNSQVGCCFVDGSHFKVISTFSSSFSRLFSVFVA